MTKSIHPNFESKCRQLIGHALDRVQYAEIDYFPENPKPCYNTRYPEIDTVDFSVILTTTTGDEVEFFWDDEFYSYGVGIKINEKSLFSGNRKWDVSGESIWTECVGQHVTEVVIYWDETWTESTATGFRNDYTYPLALGMFFSNGKEIIISAGEFKSENDETPFTGSDNLLVTSSEQTALQAQMIFPDRIADNNGNRNIWKRLSP